MRSITSTEAKTRLNAVLAEVERSGSPITITNHGRPVAVLAPVHPMPRTFGQFPSIAITQSFDDPLPETELAAWETGS